MYNKILILLVVVLFVGGIQGCKALEDRKKRYQQQQAQQAQAKQTKAKQTKAKQTQARQEQAKQTQIRQEQARQAQAKQKKVKQSTTASKATVTSAASKSSVYKPSGLYVDLDFESEKVKPSKSDYDVLEMTSANGKKTSLGIMYEGGNKKDRYAKIIADPTKNATKGNHVIQYWLKHARVPDQKKGKFKGRIQLNFADIDKTSIFQRYRLYLHPDLNIYRQYPKQNGWFTISEFWMGAKWKRHPYPFRMTLGLVKPNGVGKPLYFAMSGEIADGGALKKGRWKGIWDAIGANFEVPVGEWLDVEIGYKQGDKNSGRIYMAVKREKDKGYTTIFDKKDWTYHPDSPKPVPLTDWQPIKIYTSKQIVDFVRKGNGVTQLYWDDFKAYDNW